jgi:iron complex transport system substrate-binding protein
MRLRPWRLLLLLLLQAAVHAAEYSPPQRIVSLNLCTDQMLLLLAAPERIRMLSQLAADPAWSWQAQRAAGIARFDGSIENVMSTEPDLVLTGSMAQVDTARVLRRLGYRVETLEMPESIHASLTFISRVAELVGERAEGARLRRQTRKRIVGVRADRGAGPALRALVYLPNGISPGPGSLKHELLTAAGFSNLAKERGIEGYGSISLEELLIGAPRLLIIDAADLQHVSLSQQLLHHPALAGRIPARTVPSALWVCGGPQIAEAAEIIRDYRKELERQPPHHGADARQ